MNAAVLASIPSPDQGVWHLGPLPLRGYALCILAGIGLAVWICQIRWRQRGGDPTVVLDIATWAVPFGVIGGRLYHLVTSPQQYFGEGGDPVKAFYIWEGGLGIWGAIFLGGVGAWIAVRRRGILLPPFADALAPGLLIAQAFGRWGNWFNNELYGKALDSGNPFALKIYEWDSSTGQAIRNAAGDPVVKGYFEPTFLYECVWNVLAALFIIGADRRFKLGHGRVFALYVMTYCLGRGYIETLRIDEANHILGLRLNVWTAILLFTGGLVYLIVSSRLRPGRDLTLYRPGHEPAEQAGEQEPAAPRPESDQTPNPADSPKPADGPNPDPADDPGPKPDPADLSSPAPSSSRNPDPTDGNDAPADEAGTAARKSGN